MNLANMTIPAPIDGVVHNKPAQIGDVVGLPREPSISPTSRASMVETDVPEARLSS